MSLDKKLKQAALSVALRHMLKNKEKSKERTCRNIIELGKELSSKPILETDLSSLYKELIGIIDDSGEEKLKSWIINAFQLGE